MNTFMNIETKYLRTQKSKHLKELHNRGFDKRTNLNVTVYKNATILPLNNMHDNNILWGRGGLSDSNGNYVKETSIPGVINNSYEYENVINENCKVVFLGYLRKHWGEFFVYSIPKLWYFISEDSAEIDKYVFYTDINSDKTVSGNYREFLELLGIWDKIEIINIPTRYTEVVLPDDSYNSNMRYYSSLYVDIFETIAANTRNKENWKKREKIYLTRSALKKAVVNEVGMDLLDDFFIRNGFYIVSPEKISLSELIYLINNSDIVAAQSGTLPHNMLFSTVNNNLLIIERNAVNNRVQIDINIMKNLSVTYIDANFSLYPVELAYGPFLYGYTKCLEQFAKDNNYYLPAKEFFATKYKKKIFNKYLKRYKIEHYTKWYLQPWMYNEIDSIYEAYSESADYFGEFMNAKKFHSFYQLFDSVFMKHYLSNLKNRLRK